MILSNALLKSLVNMIVNFEAKKIEFKLGVRNKFGR